MDMDCTQTVFRIFRIKVNFPKTSLNSLTVLEMHSLLIKKMHPTELGLSSVLPITITWNLLKQIYPTFLMLS